MTGCFSKCLGSFDISSLPETKSQVPNTEEMPTYVNTQQIDAQVLAALQAEADSVTKGMAAAAKESPQKDLFDMSKTWLPSTDESVEALENALVLSFTYFHSVPFHGFNLKCVCWESE